MTLHFRWRAGRLQRLHWWDVDVRPGMTLRAVYLNARGSRQRETVCVGGGYHYRCTLRCEPTSTVVVLPENIALFDNVSRANVGWVVICQHRR